MNTISHTSSGTRSRLLFLTVSVLLLSAPPLAFAKSLLSAPKRVKVYRNSATSLVLYWDRVKGAKGYRVYRYDKKKKAYRKLVDTKRLLKIDKKLKSDTVYRYKVRAYTKTWGQKQFGKYSYSVSAITFSPRAKWVNARGVFLGIKRPVEIGINTKWDLEPELISVKAGNAKKKKIFDIRFRFSSSNKKVFMVNKKGIFTGKKPGSAYLTVRAHNGSAKRATIIVRDFANPKEFWTEDASWEASLVLSTVPQELKAVASYFNLHRSQTGKLYLDENDKLINPNKIKLGAIQDEVYQLLTHCH
jgi:hypothetical protein